MLKILTNNHLTQTEIRTIKQLIDMNISCGGTNKKRYKIKSLENNEYEIEIYDYYAIAKKSFDCRPESKIPQWHKEINCVIKYN